MSSVRQYTSDAIQYRRSDGTLGDTAEKSHPAVLRYELHACDGRDECFQEQCLEISKTLEELRTTSCTAAFKTIAHCALKALTLGKLFLRYTDSKAQKDHILRHLPPTLLRLEDDCTFQATTHSNLAVHKRSHTGQSNVKKILCDYGDCGKTFHSQRDLERHKKTQTGQREEWLCKCGASLGGKQALDIHKRAHCRLRITSTVHECPDCGKRYGKYNTLAKRRRAAHTRPAQIIGFAASSGLLGAGMPCLGLGASPAVAAPVSRLTG